MTFSSLPPEVHSIILDFAQQEGNQNLILVSKYFHAIALPLLYRILFLPTRRRVLALDDTLKRNPELAVHIRHILMSDRNRDEFHVVLPDFIVFWPQTHAERLVRRQRIRDWLVERDQELCAFRQALRYVLSLVSPNLQSLTLLHYEHSIRTLHDLLTFHYPYLTELTIRGDYPPLPNTIHLPALERLHLAAGDMPNPWASFSALANGCPRLTHLRITEPLSCILSGSVLANAFEVALGQGEYDPDALAMPLERTQDGKSTPAPRPRLPPSIVELQLQPYPAEMSAVGLPYPDHVEMINRLKVLEASSKIFKLLPAKDEDYVLPYSFDSAARDWRNRMDGELGCWRTTV